MSVIINEILGNQYFIKLLNFIYLLLISPFRYIYIRGPAVKGIGFWENLNKSDICSSLTKIPVSHWQISSDNIEECDKLIDRKVESFMIGFFLLFFTLLLYYSLNYVFFVRPIIKYNNHVYEIRKNQNHSTVIADISTHCEKK